MSTIGSINVKISADSRGLEQGIGKANQAVKGSSEQLNENLKQWAKWGAAAAAAAAGVAAAIIKSQLSQIDTLAKTSDRLNIAVEDLQALRFAAEQTGASAATLDGSLQKMTRNLGDAKNGTGEAKDALERLGLAAQDLIDISPDQAFTQIAQAMQGLDTQAEKIDAAFRIFGRSGAELVNLLDTGADGINAFKKEAQELGLTLTRDAARGAEEANDAINRMRTALNGATQQIAADLAPAIADIANSFVDFAKDAGGVGQVINDSADKIGTAINALSGLIIARMSASAGAFIAAQIQVVRYQAALASMAGVSATAAASQAALATATTALSRAYALLGGPVGVIALTAYGVYQLTGSYRQNTEAAEERLQKLREELRLMPQLATAQAEYDRAVSNAYKPLQAYTNEVDRLFATQAQGLSRSQFQEQFDKSSAALKRAEDRLQRYTEAGVTNQSRMMEAEEQVRKYRAQVDILNGIFPELTTSEQQAGEAIGAVTSKLADQLYQLHNGAQAMEILNAIREAGVDINSAEGQAIANLIRQRDALAESVKAEADARTTGSEFIAQLQERFKTEEQLQLEKYAREKALIQQNVADTAEQHAMLERLQAEHNERMAEIQATTVPEGMQYTPEANQAFLDGLAERFASESELWAMKYQSDLERLQEARAQELITEEQFLAQKASLEDGYAQQQVAREQQVQQQITSMRMSAAQSAIGLLDLFAGKSKAAAIAAIALNKALSIAQIIQNTAVAQMRALAELGPIAGPPAAAKIGMYGKIQAGIAAATGLVQIGQAASGSASTLGSVNGLPAVRTMGGQSVGQPSGGDNAPRTISINLVGGGMFSAEQIRELIGMINEQTGDGVNLAVGG